MRKLLSIVFLFLIVFSLSALELTDGRIKLILHEDLGRFSLYYLTDVRNNRYTPLFLEEDPRTTFLTLLEGNKTYRMGEAAGFSQSIEEKTNSTGFIWESNTLRVEETFQFISSSSSALSDGISITVTVTNLSEGNLSVGLRYVFDTYLGEKDKHHFFASENITIDNEKEFSSSSMPRFIVSSTEEISPGFQIMLSDQGITTPDTCVCANWKRLNDSSWDYDVRPNRNFNHLPYSINDSAIGLTYDAETIKNGEKRTIRLAMGRYTPEGYTPDQKEKKNDISDVFKRAMAKETTSDDGRSVLQSDLLTVRELLKEINTILDSEGTVTESELEVMNQVIEELKKRKLNYEDR